MKDDGGLLMGQVLAHDGRRGLRADGESEHFVLRQKNHSKVYPSFSFSFL